MNLTIKNLFAVCLLIFFAGQIKEISGPTGVVHTAGVNREIFTSIGFAGVKLPPEWEKIINESGIPKAELMEHADVILDILRSMDEKRRRRIAEMIPDDKEVPTTIGKLCNYSIDKLDTCHIYLSLR